MMKRTIAQHHIQAQQDIQFYYTGTEQCAPGQSWGPAIKDHYKLFFVHSGRGIYRSEEMTFEIRKGHVFLISPYVVSFFQADREEPWNFSWVAFNGGIVQEYLAQAGFTPASPVITCDREQEIRQCLSQLFDANQRYYSKPLQMTSALYAFLAVVLENARKDASSAQPGSQMEAYVAQAVAFMNNNFMRTMTIEEMADSLGLNRKYMAGLFKAAKGIPPQQYLGELRLRRACELLTGTSLSVKEIAYSVGYANPLHFTRMFKQTYGVAPTGYRTRGGS